MSLSSVKVSCLISDGIDTYFGKLFLNDLTFNDYHTVSLEYEQRRNPRKYYKQVFVLAKMI